jgi:hypothetical protein
MVCWLLFLAVSIGLTDHDMRRKSLTTSMESRYREANCNSHAQTTVCTKKSQPMGGYAGVIALFYCGLSTVVLVLFRTC